METLTDSILAAIERYLVLSTGHITLDDSLRLAEASEEGNRPFVVYYDTWGWRLPLTESNVQSLRGAKFSPSFWKCVDAAQKLDCGWLHLDQDGHEMVEELGLDEHEW